MSEDGERPAVARRSGPVSGSCPWSGLSLRSGVLEDAGSFGRPHLKLDPSSKRPNNVCHHYPIIGRSGEYSRTPRLRDSNNCFVRCSPCECRTPPAPSSPATHRNKPPGPSHKVSSSNTMSHGSLRTPSPLSNRRTQGRTRHGFFKHHFPKIRDSVDFPVSVHPVQPCNIRSKNLVHKEVPSYRMILNGEAVLGKQSHSVTPSAHKSTCVSTSNLDIKTENKDEACAASLVDAIKGSELADEVTLAAAQRSPSVSSHRIYKDHAEDNIAEYQSSFIRKYDTRMERADCPSCLQVQFAAPDDETLMMEKNGFPDDDSIKCIHPCGISSSIGSGGTLEPEGMPTERRTVVVQKQTESLSEDEAVAKKDFIDVFDRIESPILSGMDRSLHSLLYSSEPSSDEFDSDEVCRNRYVRDSCNDSNSDVRNERNRVSTLDKTKTGFQKNERTLTEDREMALRGTLQEMMDKTRGVGDEVALKEKTSVDEKAQLMGDRGLKGRENASTSREQLKLFKQEGEFSGQDIDTEQRTLVQDDQTTSHLEGTSGRNLSEMSGGMLKSGKEDGFPSIDERNPRQEQLDLVPLKYKSSSTQTIDVIGHSNQISTENTGINVFVAQSADKIHSSDKAYFDIKSNDFLINIRQGQVPGNICPGPVSEKNKFITEGLPRDTVLVGTTPDLQIMTTATRDGSGKSGKAAPETSVNATFFMSMPQKPFEPDVEKSHVLVVNQNISQNNTVGAFGCDFSKLALANEDRYFRADSDVFETKDTLYDQGIPDSKAQIETSSIKSCIECQVSFPLTSNDSDKSILSSQLKTQSSKAQIITVQCDSCSVCQESEQSGEKSHSVAEKSYDLKWDEIDKISPAEAQIRHCFPDGHVCPAYVAYRYSDQEDVPAVFRYQSKNKNIFGEFGQSFEQLSDDTNACMVEPRTGNGSQDREEYNTGVHKMVMDSQPPFQGIRCHCGSYESGFQNCEKSYIGFNSMNSPFCMSNAAMQTQTFEEEVVESEAAWGSPLQTISEVESKATRNDNSQQTTLKEDSKTSADADMPNDYWEKIGPNPENSVAIHEVISTRSRAVDKVSNSEKTESSKVTRNPSISKGSQSDEEPICLIERLDHGHPGVEMSDENMTAKSVEELTDEDNRLIVDMTINPYEKMISDNENIYSKEEVPVACISSREMSRHEETNTNKKAKMCAGTDMTEKVTEPIFSANETSQEENTISRYYVKRSSSGVGINTLEEYGRISDCVMISEVSREVGSRMSVVENQVVMHVVPKQYSQLVPTSVQLSLTNAHPGVLSNNLSLSSGTTRDKEGFKSEGTTRSGPIEYAISVKEENGVETQLSVDIVTVTDQVERVSTDDTHGIVESPFTEVSTSSWATRVLDNPPSCNSTETNKYSSEAIDGYLCETRDACKTADEHPIRTKLKRRTDRKPETRNRVRLTNGNYFSFGKKSSNGSMQNIFWDDHPKRRWREVQRHEKHQVQNKCSCDNESVLSGAHAVPTSDEAVYFEKYRSTSDLSLREFNRTASDLADNAYSRQKSVSPSLLNLGNFSPPHPSSCSNLRHRLAVSISPNSFILSSPHSRSKCSARYLLSDENLNSIRNWKPSSRESKRRPHRANDFPSQSSEDVRPRRPGRNMIKEDPESDATFLVPEGNHGRIVTFENIPSPRNTIRRSTPTPHGESLETFEDTPRRSRSPNKGYTEDRFLEVSRLSSDASGCSVDDITSAAQLSRQGGFTRTHLGDEAPSFHQGYRVTEKPSAERVKTICPTMQQHFSSRTSSTEVQTTCTKMLQHFSPRISICEVQNTCPNMPQHCCPTRSSDEVQTTCPKMSQHFSPRRSSDVIQTTYPKKQHLSPRTSSTEVQTTCPQIMQRSPRTSSAEVQATCPKMQHFSPRTSSGAQTNPIAIRSHADLRLASSKTTLLSLADAGVCSTSRLSSPTPSDIPSPPPSATPSASPNRLTVNSSRTKVDVAVGIGTLDYDPVLPTFSDGDDGLTTIEIPVSPTGIRYMSTNSGVFHAVADSSVQGNATRSSESKTCELEGVIPLLVPSSIHLAGPGIPASRGVGVTTSSTLELIPSTHNRLLEELLQEQGVSEVQRLHRGTCCGVKSRLQTPTDNGLSDLDITPISKAAPQTHVKNDEVPGRRKTKDGADATIGSTKDTLADAIETKTLQRPLVLNSRYRFGSANHHSCKYSDLMGEIADVNPAVPSRTTPSRSSTSANRLSPNLIVGSQCRISARHLISSPKRSDANMHRSNRESPSHTQSPRPKLISRPADGSVVSCSPTETSNQTYQRGQIDTTQGTDECTNRRVPAGTNQTTPANTNQRAMADPSQTASSDGQRTLLDKQSNAKRPLPPAALDQSEEGDISGFGSFSNARITTTARFEPRDGAVLVADVPECSTLRLVGNGSMRVGSGCIASRGQSSGVSPQGIGSGSYLKPSTGRSARDSFRESTNEDIPSLSRQDAAAPSLHPHLDQFANESSRQQVSSGTTNCGVLCPEIDQFSQRRHRICISIQPSLSGPLKSDAIEADSSEADAANIEDTNGQRETRETLVEKINGNLARSHGHVQSRSSSHSVEKVKSSHKSVHKTGSKTRKGSGTNHVIRCTPASSKTSQPKTPKSIVVCVSSSAEGTKSHLPPVRGMVPDSWVPNLGGEDNYIEEVSENTENFPTDRSPIEPNLQPADNFAIPGASEFPPDGTAGVVSTDDVTPPSHSSVETSESAKSHGFQKRNTARDIEPNFRDARQDTAASRVREESETASNNSGWEQDQATDCVGDSICKDTGQPSPGKRYGLYTTRVGYIGAPRSLVPTPVSASRHVRRPQEPTPSVPKFQSKFHYYVRHQFYKNRKPHQTMGVAELPPELPNAFVKKQSKTIQGPFNPVADKDVQFPFILARPDGKPKRKCKTIYDEARGKAPFKEEKCERDYIQANIRNACQAVPLKRPARFVDTVHGHTQLVEPSGLEPRYVFRKGYGEVPAYLSQVGSQSGTASGFAGDLARRRSASIQGGQEKSGGNAENDQRRHPLRYITEPERAQLLEGLKQNWQELTTIFQGLPMMTDTVAKIKRKETLENELRQLEKDIASIEQNPIIYIEQGAGDACNADHIWTD